MAKLTTAELLAKARQGASADKPKSAADLLAAARGEAPAGGSTGGLLAAARGDAKPAQSAGGLLAAARGGTAPKSSAADMLAAARAAKPEVSTEGKSVQEMIEAARNPRPAESEKPKLPKLPSKSLPAARKPVPAPKKQAEEGVSRRGILGSLVVTPFALGWGLFSAATGVFTLGLARFLMPNVLVEPPTRFKVGTPGDFPPETVITKFKAERGIWMVNTSKYNGEQMIYALGSVCTHLGCTPNWLEGEQKFKCPCHGSGFYINGINFEGPAPRPLERHALRLAEDGMLEVDKSRKFQEEMGQWEDTASYVPV